MKKTLNLLLGLSLMASAYAKSPAFKPTIAPLAPMILPPAPISPTGSIALARNADDIEYAVTYTAPYIGVIDGYNTYNLTFYFYEVDLTTGVYSLADVPANFSITSTSYPLTGTLDWPAGTDSYYFGELIVLPSGDYPVTTSQTTNNSYPILQSVYPTSALPDL